MFWKKKMATQTKKKLDQQLREVLAQQLNEKQTKLTEAEAENRKLKNEIEKIQENFDKKEEQLEKNLGELHKKLVEMEQQQNEQQKSNEQMEKMLQNENDKRKNDRQGMEEKMDKLEEKLDKKLEKEQKQLQKENIVSEDHLKAILERIGEIEKQQQQQTKAFLQLQNDQKKILEKVSEIEKQTKKKVFLKFQQNCWDSFACHEDIEISGDKSLIVHHKGNTSDSWRSVFAKYPIVLNKHLSDFFYYEISVQKKEKNWSITFGFAVKQQTKLDGAIHREKGTYIFTSYGDILINGKGKERNAKYSYGVGDTVGIGVNSATRQIIFTKNGLRLDISDFFVDPSFADGSFYPFVSSFGFDDKIEANFGPNFKFDLETL
ncbi:hypothetical protein niasHS_011461 [Heterodera schachtii]|uniref:B30.2/SPRY domain-containing protein n=1 Tax=Heterodera schachtii TaxID=97005 RepID=A0ABD2IPF6_HETSC